MRGGKGDDGGRWTDEQREEADGGMDSRPDRTKRSLFRRHDGVRMGKKSNTARTAAEA